MPASNYPYFAHPKPVPKAKVRKDKAKDADSRERAVYAQVDKRDKYRCRLTGRRGNPFSLDPLDRLHHHHVIERSLGGATSTDNVVTVHREIHDLLHQHRVFVSGNADELLRWAMKQDAVEQVYGKRRPPLWVTVVADEQWQAFLREQVRA